MILNGFEYFANIRIRKVSREKYLEILKSWNRQRDRVLREDREYAEIIEPVQYSDYSLLLYDFLKNPYADEVMVMSNGFREKEYVRCLITDKHDSLRLRYEKDKKRNRLIQKMYSADIKHSGFLELKFKLEPEKIGEKQPRLEIGFAEVKHLIMGYEIKIPAQFLKHVTKLHIFGQADYPYADYEATLLNPKSENLR